MITYMLNCPDDQEVEFYADEQKARKELTDAEGGSGTYTLHKLEFDSAGNLIDSTYIGAFVDGELTWQEIR